MARLSLVVLLLGLAIGVWVLMGVGGPAPEVPGTAADAARDPEPPVPSMDPAGLADLEVAIEVSVRGRILPSERTRSFRLVRGTVEVPAETTFLTPADGTALVAFVLPDGSRLYRVLGPDDHETVPVVDTSLTGRVVDSGGDPVQGAEVWCGEDRTGGDDPVTTDADGQFTVPHVVGGTGVPIVVNADGYASRYQVLDIDGSLLEPVFVLGPGVTLEVQLAADVMDGSRVRVFLAPGEEGDSRLQQFPFFMAAVGRGWRADAAGTARIDGLPEGSRVEVIAHHPLAYSARSEPLRVQTGSRAVVPLRRLPPRTGRVIDAQGNPLRGMEVVSHAEARIPPRPRASRWLLPRQAGVIGVAVDTTGADGGFAVASGRLLRVQARDYAGLEIRLPPDVGEPLELVLFEPRPGAPTLRVVPPPCSGSYRIRCRPFGNEWRTVPCGQPFRQVFTDASLVDVKVQIRQAGVLQEPRLFSGLDVQRLTELDLR